VDEEKLARVLGSDQYYASLDDELAEVGAVGGYASPIGLDPGKLRVVADPSVRASKNAVSGANRPDYHIRNVNVPRDFEPGEWADLAEVEPEDPCPHCGSALVVEPAFALARAKAPEAPVSQNTTPASPPPSASRNPGSVRPQSRNLDLGIGTGPVGPLFVLGAWWLVRRKKKK